MARTPVTSECEVIRAAGMVPGGGNIGFGSLAVQPLTATGVPRSFGSSGRNVISDNL